MGAVKQKLKSKRGASIILALLFFLLCAMVGGVVLASAASNAGRLTHMRDEQAAYLSVSSAAKLVRDELEGITFHGEYTTVEIDGTIDPDLTVDTFKLTDPAANSLTTTVTTWAEDVYRNPALGPLSYDFTIVPSTSLPGIKDVTVTLTMNDPSADEYSIQAVIVLVDGTNRYTMTLNVPAVVKRDTKSTTDTTKTDVVDGVETITETVTITKTIDIVLGKGTIVKGDAS